MKEKPPLHLRLEAMSVEQIVSNFPHDLADDLAEQGMSAADVAHVREAAGVIMRLCGIVAPKKSRRVTGTPRRPTSPEKLALQHAKREAARAAKATTAKPAIVDPNAQEQREDLSHISAMPMGERGRRHFAFVRHATTPLAASMADGTAGTNGTMDDGSEAGWGQGVAYRGVRGRDKGPWAA